MMFAETKCCEPVNFTTDTTFVSKIKGFFTNIFNNVRAFFNRKRISVEQLLQYKDRLEKEIKVNRSHILSIFENAKTGKKENYYSKIYDSNRELSNLLKEKEEQLIVFKLAQQRANLMRHSDLQPNFFYIYKLSNLTQTRLGLESTLKGCEGFKLKYMQKKIENLSFDISKIEARLSKFNKTRKIRVFINPNLKLI